MKINNIYWSAITVQHENISTHKSNCLVRIDEHTISIQDRDRDGHLIYVDPKVLLLTSNKIKVEANKMIFVNGVSSKVPVTIEVDL